MAKNPKRFDKGIVLNNLSDGPNPTDTNPSDNIPGHQWVIDTNTSKTVAVACFNVCTDVLTSAAHGLANGQHLKVTTVTCAVTTCPAGLLDLNDKVFVICSTACTFKISTTSGGSAINIASTGSLTFTVIEEQIQAYLCSGAEKILTDTNTVTSSNKTFTSPVLNGCITGTGVLDEDCFCSNSATKLATQQSIKAYIDAQNTAQNLCFTDDSCTACLCIDLDSESLKIAGGAGISTSGSGNTLTVAVDCSVVTVCSCIVQETTIFCDNKFTLQDNCTNSKKAQFQVSGISACTTRTFTLPDESAQIITESATQTLNNKMIGLQCGTTCCPAIYFACSPSTGLFRPGANEMAFTVDGVNAFEFLKEATLCQINVGLGTCANSSFQIPFDVERNFSAESRIRNSNLSTAVGAASTFEANLQDGTNIRTSAFSKTYSLSCQYKGAGVIRTNSNTDKGIVIAVEDSAAPSCSINNSIRFNVGGNSTCNEVARWNLDGSWELSQCLCAAPANCSVAANHTKLYTKSNELFTFDNCNTERGILSTVSTSTVSNKTFNDSTTTFQCTCTTSRKFQFQASGISNCTTRTLTIPNANTTLVGTCVCQTLSSKTLASPKVTTQLCLCDQAEIRFKECCANGCNYVALKAPAALTANVCLTLPPCDGACGQALLTNGCGVTSWGNPTAVICTNVTSVTCTYCATTANDVILASGGAFTVNLYTASCNSGKELTIKKTCATLSNIITIDGSACQTICGSTTTTLNTEGETLKIISDGSNWQILKREIPSKWNSYCLTIGGVTCAPTKATTTTADCAYWRREGDSIRLRYSYSHTCNSGAAVGSGFYLFPPPSGITFNTCILTADGSSLRTRHVAGTGYSDNGSTRAFGYAKLYDSTNVVLYTETNASSGNGVGSAHYTMTNATIFYNFEALVPVSGWNS